MVSFRNLQPGFVYKLHENGIHTEIIFRVVKKFHQNDYCVILLGDNYVSILGEADGINQNENAIHMIVDNSYIPILNDEYCIENTNPIEGGKVKKILNKSVDKKNVDKKSVDKKRVDKKSVDKKSVDKKKCR